MQHFDHIKRIVRTGRAVLCVAAALLLAGVISIPSEASTVTQSPAVACYEVSGDDDISLSDDAKIASFSYGKKSIGKFSLSNTSDKTAKYNGFKVYFADDAVSFNYSYDGSFQTDVKEDWNLTDYDSKVIGEIKTEEKGGLGEILVQRSEDGKDWETVAELPDFFQDNPSGKSGIYTASKDEVRRGTYYRVITAYRMKRKVGEKADLPDWMQDRLDFLVGDYEVCGCAEVYEFYLSYSKNPITLQDIVSGKDVSSTAVVSRGFRILKNGSGAEVTVSANKAKASEAEDYASFYEPGEYTVTTQTKTGEKYQTTIQIRDGLKMTTISPDVYTTEKKSDGYDNGTQVERSTDAGICNLTTLSIAQTGGDEIEIADNESIGCTAYGITGSGVSLFLNLDNTEKLTANGWEVADDEWGKKKSQTIAGSYTGTVMSGALIVKTSDDGHNWTDVSKGSYADGLTTTDYGTNFAGKGNVCIYCPDGDDVTKGTYIRVYYAYKVQKKDSSKTWYRGLEQYEFYLCESNLGAVTFHNLTVKDQISQVYGDEDETTAEMRRAAETLTSGSCTVTGFQVDLSNVQSAAYTIRKNGKDIAPASDNTYSETGKYEIHITNMAGASRDVVLYVDPETNDEAMKTYFGDSFITADSKRIYKEGSYPVYEGGSLYYSIASVDEKHLPVGGEITNTTTGNTITVPATREGKSGTIEEPGEYTAVFSTSPEYDEDEASGDQRVFTFHFSVIKAGTAPGPKVNQKNLRTYAQSTPADAYPVYYGLTYESALKGRITLAFASREAAIEYAYQYEKGTVEEQEDGTYRYTGNSSSQKEGYGDLWDLTDDINEFAEKEVKTCWFDLSDPFTYQTLSEDTLAQNANLRTLELQNSIVVFADDEQKQALTSGSTKLPLLSPKPCAVIDNAGEDNETVEQTTQDFQFIKDKYGCDSYSVVITDSAGKEISIAYNKDVGAQLDAADCASGVVTVTEETKYGDKAQYQAVYIRPGDNTASIQLACYENGKKTTKTLTQDDDGTKIRAESFSIASVTDELDPYDLVLVTKDGSSTPYAGDQTIQKAWSDDGTYTVKVVNRIGAAFQFTVTVASAD